MRARNIKPAFWTNEDLAEIPYEARLLFIGLWCMADREGRLEERVKKISAEIFPYDDVDISKMIDVITCHGFLKRYEIEGKRYIQIINFEKHQHPHPHEARSVIPRCNDNVITCNDLSRPSRADVRMLGIRNDDIRNDGAVTVPAFKPRPKSKPLRHSGAIGPDLKKMDEARVAAEPYRIPKDPAGKFLMVFKKLQGYDLEDREWDAAYLEELRPDASRMMLFFKDDWKAAGHCAEGIVAELTEKKLSWSLRTIINRAASWRKSNEPANA